MLYYTGAKESDAEQPIPSQSLGGYCSATQIDNEDFDTIFEQISNVQEFGTRYRLICFKNVFAAPLSNIKIYAESGELIQLELAVVLPTSTQMFEKIKKDTSKPYQASFKKTSEEDVISIATPLQPNAVIGIWLKAEIASEYLTKFDQFYNSPTQDDQSALELLQKTDRDVFKLKIEWDPMP